MKEQKNNNSNGTLQVTRVKSSLWLTLILLSTGFSSLCERERERETECVHIMRMCVCVCVCVCVRAWVPPKWGLAGKKNGNVVSCQLSLKLYS